MELAEAYVAIKADTSRLQGDMAKAKTIVAQGMNAQADEVEKGASKAAGYMDKQATRLASAFMRMGGGISLIRVSTAALAGAFEEIKAEKAFDTARQTGNLNAMIAAYQRANVASRRWLEAIPFLGGSLSQLAQTFQDDSIVQFGQRLEDIGNKSKAAGGDLDELAKAQIAHAKAAGAPPAKIATMEAELMERGRAERLGKLFATAQDARALMEEIEKKAAIAREKAGEGIPAAIQFRATRKAEALETEAQDARVKARQADKELRQAMKARPEWTATEKATIEKADKTTTGVVWGAGAGNMPSNIAISSTEEAVSILQDIRSDIRDLKTRQGLGN